MFRTSVRHCTAKLATNRLGYRPTDFGVKGALAGAWGALAGAWGAWGGFSGG